MKTRDVKNIRTRRYPWIKLATDMKWIPTSDGYGYIFILTC